jgi:acetyl-CoA acetyltransferase
VPGELSGKAAIAGIGATDFSKNSGRSELRLAAEAVLDALDDAGLTPGDVDGMVTFTMDSNTEVALWHTVLSTNGLVSGSARYSFGWWRTPIPPAWTIRSRTRTDCRHLPRR